MNLVDLVVLVLVAAAIFRGWRRGFLGQILELGCGFLGLLAGLALGPRVASALTDRPGVAGVLIALGVVLAGASIGQAIGFILGHKFAPLIQRARLGPLNSGLGAGFGVVVTFVVFWLVAALLVQGPSRELARAVQQSEVLEVVNKALPRPPDLLAYLRHYLSTSGFPQVFTGLPPVGRPVDLPSGARAQRAIDAANQSTVRIRMPACGGIQVGSGWIAAESTVVTNAHVVAGGDADEVDVDDASGSHDGVVVSFDPRTDAAIVHVEGLAGPPLDLETDRLDRGTPGAILGFPGGGDLDAGRAAIQASYNARGLDIYGRSDVSRAIYELRAVVRQGNSGGPFVIPNGDVAGVIFAASTTDADTGYALVGSEVADDISRGTGKTTPAGTGGCTR